MNDKKIDSLINEIDKALKRETEKLNASYNFSYEKNINSYRINKDSYLIKKYKEALQELKLGEPTIIDTFGGSDNNNFNLHGIEGIVISNAMNDIHTTHEFFYIDEFVKSAEILLKIVSSK